MPSDSSRPTIVVSPDADAIGNILAKLNCEPFGLKCPAIHDGNPDEGLHLIGVVREMEARAIIFDHGFLGDGPAFTGLSLDLARMFEHLKIEPFFVTARPRVHGERNRACDLWWSRAQAGMAGAKPLTALARIAGFGEQFFYRETGEVYRMSGGGDGSLATRAHLLRQGTIFYERNWPEIIKKVREYVE